jgi:hypothetical protein
MLPMYHFFFDKAKVLTRSRFKNLTLTKYLTNGPVPVIYGLIGFLFGFYSDVDFGSESWLFKWMGSARYFFRS